LTDYGRGNLDNWGKIMNCSRCGNEVSQDDDFCARCGTPLVGYARQEDLPAAPPVSTAAQKGGATSYRFDASRWTSNDKIVGGATLFVLIALFLPWFNVNLAGLSSLGDTGAESGSVSGTTAHGWLWFVFIIGLVVLLYLLGVAGFRRLPIALPLKHERLLLAATGINLLLVVLAFLLKPGNGGITGLQIGWGFGAVIALLAAIAAVVQPARAAVAERNTPRPDLNRTSKETTGVTRD
jgi:hypothetical protein